MTQTQTFAPPGAGQAPAGQPGQVVVTTTTQQVAPVAAPQNLQTAGPGTPVAAQPRTSRRSSTPWMLGFLRTLSVLLTLLFGLGSAAIMLQTRQAMTTAAHDTEQYNRVQQIEASLLSAHARAANSFLVGGAATPQSQTDFSRDLADASRLIVDASGAQKDDQHALQNLNGDLSQYSRQMEAALSANRQGLPVATAYLDQAGETLQKNMLPQLDALTDANARRIDAATSTIHSGFILGLGALSLLSLVLTSIVTARRTHRVLNPGLVLAIILVLAATILATTIMGQVNDTIKSTRAGELADARNAARARVQAYNAKANESLSLLSRTASGGDAEQRWQMSSYYARQAMDSLRSGKTETTEAFREYVKVHRRIREYDLGGDHDSAVKRATTSAPEGSNAAFAKFDTEISKVIKSSGDSAASKLRGFDVPLLVGALATFLLSVLAAAAAAWGVGQRLKEYR